MTITDPEALKFCNETVRSESNRIASLYLDADYLADLKASMSISDFMAQHESRIRRTADAMIDAWNNLYSIENAWFNVGTGGTLSSKIPNTTEVVGDGAPGDGRPEITGQDVVRMITNFQRISDWFHDASFGGGGVGSNFDAMINTMIVVSSRGTTPLVQSQVETFVDNRCGELRTEYEASSNLRLTQVLAVAPNPDTHRVQP
jgi:hypothetical protein